MEWTRQKLAYYLGPVRTVVEFKGITRPSTIEGRVSYFALG